MDAVHATEGFKPFGLIRGLEEFQKLYFRLIILLYWLTVVALRISF